MWQMMLLGFMDSCQQTEAAACLLSSRLASLYACEELFIHQIACKGRYASAFLQRGAGDHHAVVHLSRPHRRFPRNTKSYSSDVLGFIFCGAHIGGWVDLAEALQDAHVAEPAADRGMEGLDAGKPFWCAPGKLPTFVNLWQAVMVAFDSSFVSLCCTVTFSRQQRSAEGDAYQVAACSQELGKEGSALLTKGAVVSSAGPLPPLTLF